jgi:hypothetical protein
MAGATMVCTLSHLKLVPNDVQRFLKRTDFVVGTVDVRLLSLVSRTLVDSRRWVIDRKGLDPVLSSVTNYLSAWDTDVDAAIMLFDF